MNHRALLPALLSVLAGTGATAQFVCEPPARMASVVFALGASALTEPERLKISSTIDGAKVTSAIYVTVDPRTSLLEGLPAERRSLAKKRGEYIRNFFVKAGVEEGNIQLSLDYYLSENRTEDYADDRTTHIEAVVFEGPARRICSSKSSGTSFDKARAI